MNKKQRAKANKARKAKLKFGCKNYDNKLALGKKNLQYDFITCELSSFIDKNKKNIQNIKKYIFIQRNNEAKDDVFRMVNTMKELRRVIKQFVSCRGNPLTHERYMKASGYKHLVFYHNNSTFDIIQAFPNPVEDEVVGGNYGGLTAKLKKGEKAPKFNEIFPEVYSKLIKTKQSNCLELNEELNLRNFKITLELNNIYSDLNHNKHHRFQNGSTGENLQKNKRFKYPIFFDYKAARNLIGGHDQDKRKTQNVCQMTGLPLGYFVINPEVLTGKNGTDYWKETKVRNDYGLKNDFIKFTKNIVKKQLGKDFSTLPPSFQKELLQTSWEAMNAKQFALLNGKIDGMKLKLMLSR